MLLPHSDPGPVTQRPPAEPGLTRGPRRIFICSPFAAPQSEDARRRNLLVALDLVRLALAKGFAPFAPHLLYPRVLNDRRPQEREAGMKAGLAWLCACHELWRPAWLDVSAGMAIEIEHARTLGIPVVSISVEDVRSGRELL